MHDQDNKTELILNLSLGIEFDDTSRYFDFAIHFVSLPVGTLVLEAIEKLG